MSPHRIKTLSAANVAMHQMTVRSIRSVRPNLSIFKSSWQQNLFQKSPNISNCFRQLFEKHDFLNKNWISTFLGYLWKNWATFYSNIWSHWRWLKYLQDMSWLANVKKYLTAAATVSFLLFLLLLFLCPINILHVWLLRWLAKTELNFFLLFMLNQLLQRMWMSQILLW